jgi:hypothetical protein
MKDKMNEVLKQNVIINNQDQTDKRRKGAGIGNLGN